MKRFLAILLLLAMLLPILPLLQAQAAAFIPNMPAGELLFLTLYQNGPSSYRWNADGAGSINSDIHLDDATGANCTFRLTHVENGWYGIKFIKENGTDRYVDVADKSTKEGAVLHIWESSDSKLAGNGHRQFAFYDAGKDGAGNQLYYIQVRHSGMWVGLKGNAAGKEVQLVQTSSNPQKWYVTPGTVPTTGQEAYPWTESTGLYCEFFARNTMRSVSVKGREGNLETDGMNLNVYTIGQSSRWLLRYNKTYKAYEIASTKYETKEGLSLTGKVWDTESESATGKVNIWSLQDKTSNDNTSQLWRFVANGDGTYKIYNARSGKFVCVDADVLTQGEKSGAQAFEISFLSTNAPANYGAVFSTGKPELFWMSKLPDCALLSEVNIPATHDTGANAVIQDMNGVLDNASITKCQKHYFEEQLATGIRSFDVRCNAGAGNGSVHDVMIVHGGAYFQCYNRQGKELSLGEILDISKAFLKAQPTETVILLIKPDDGTHEDIARTLGQYINGNTGLFWLSDQVPTVGQARGKIVLLRRFEDQTGNAAFGPDLTKWDDQDYGATKGLVAVPQAGGAQVYVQDAYQQTGDNKITYVQGAMQDSSSGRIPKDAYIYNYTSCTLGFVIDTTRTVNAWLYGQNLQGKRLGMVMMNYSDLMMARKIYATNALTYNNVAGHSYDNKVTAPSCTESGYTTHTCTVCGDSYVDSYVAALGHNYESVTSGYTVTYTCTSCGDTYTETIAPDPNLKNGIYLENGLYYYYINDQIQYAAGLVFVDGSYYYIRSGGYAAIGSYWCTNTNGITAEGFYIFAEDGKMILTDTTKTGIYLEDGKYYYYIDGEIQFGAGLVMIDGSYYYIRSGGYAAIGSYWVTNTNGITEEGFYIFAEDGKMILNDTSKNGIYLEGGLYYYYKDGEIQFGAGLVLVDGAYYYIRSGGYAAIGEYYVSKTNGLLPEGIYTFGRDGRMIPNDTE